MDENANELLREVQALLECSNQNWLFGAGISYDSNIPLMYPLTDRIQELITEGDYADIYFAIKNQLNSNAHIEHFLSQIGDIITLIERTDKKELYINNQLYNVGCLNSLYQEIIYQLGNIIRYGYKKEGDIERVGTIIKPIVEIDNHRKFVRALLGICKERTANINFFTTNYDTLLEDALIIEHEEIRDGFLGAAMGFWNPEEAFSRNKDRKNIHNVYKLHGSIDWYRDQDNSLIRCRYGTKYLANNHNLLIYPQATKYVETQKDPFAYLFAKFRESLNQGRDNVLVTNGYSFGDNHINNEIVNSIKRPYNKTNMVIFVKENMNNGQYELCKTLKNWIQDKEINDRVFILTNKGIYNGNRKSCLQDKRDDYKWWTFTGMIEDIMLGGFEVE